MKSKKSCNFEKIIGCVGLCASLVLTSAVSAAETEGMTREVSVLTEAVLSEEPQEVQSEVQTEAQEEHSEAQADVQEMQNEVQGTETEVQSEIPADVEQELRMQETQEASESETEAATEMERAAAAQEAATETEEEELILEEGKFEPGIPNVMSEEKLMELPEEIEPDFANVGQAPSNIPSGVCGAEDAAVFWQLQDGVLTISGTGEMISWERADQTPWYEYSDAIMKVVVEEGVTSVGAYAFYGFTGIQEINLAGSVTSIGAFAFFDCSGLGVLCLG